MTFGKSLQRNSPAALSGEYDALYQRYIEHDGQVSSYAGMASNPFERNEEGEQVRKNIELVSLLT
jgi:hypothetical protein